MSGKAKVPRGRGWVVRRRWVPRLGSETVWGRFRRRMRRTKVSGDDGVEAGVRGLDLIGEGLAALAIGVVVVAALFFGFPVLLAIVDIVVVLVLGLIGLLARVLFRRPWTIEARSTDGDEMTWRVVGWRASGERIDEIRQLVASGVMPQPDSVESP